MHEQKSRLNRCRVKLITFAELTALAESEWHRESREKLFDAIVDLISSFLKTPTTGKAAGCFWRQEGNLGIKRWFDSGSLLSG